MRLGRNAGGKRAAQFALRDDIDAGAEAAQRLQHRLVRIGLHRIADHASPVGEGFRKDAVMALQRRGGIDSRKGVPTALAISGTGTFSA